MLPTDRVVLRQRLDLLAVKEFELRDFRDGRAARPLKKFHSNGEKNLKPLSEVLEAREAGVLRSFNLLLAIRFSKQRVEEAHGDIFASKRGKLKRPNHSNQHMVERRGD